MSAFFELDWSRIDCKSIVAHGGLITIEERRHLPCREWLQRHGYEITTLDCRPGLAVAIPELGEIVGWRQRFEGSDSRNLDALRDLFKDFTVPESGGSVFEIIRADLAWKDDSRWLFGFLRILTEHSREALAIGRRFFALLVIPEGSPLIGLAYDEDRIPFPFFSPCREINEFVR